MSELKLRPPKDKSGESGGKLALRSRARCSGCCPESSISCPYRPLREPGGRPRGAVVSGAPDRTCKNRQPLAFAPFEAPSKLGASWVKGCRGDGREEGTCRKRGRQGRGDGR